MAAAKGPVVKAVEKDLKELRRRAPHLAGSAHAASALALARELDDGANSATSKSMCARALRESLDRLLELAPPVKETDGIDEVSARREARLARSAAT